MKRISYRFGAVIIVTAMVALVATITTQSANAAPLTYVALGDSVAAGAGLPLASNASQEDTLCRRSPQSYPYLLAAQLGTSVTNLACSGAKTSTGIRNGQPITQNNVRYTIPSQLDRAFSNGRPDLITMTIGANDLSFSSSSNQASWSDIIARCYTAECGGARDTAAITYQLTTLKTKLAYTLHEIKSRSGTSTPPRVLITEYYYPIASTACFNGQISVNEAQWINTQAYNLNKSIRQTIEATTKVSSFFKGTYNFATYVPVNFNGHGLCSSDPWIQGLSDPAPIHPTAAGQSVYAAALYPVAAQ